ncbi:energy transducer TonB [Dokdonella sp. MW10]|uniref:energy transducer TonB n=1 Tax=Dokdonella sp. MW10 TaxID=2992926 RepID=UPI003F7DA23D
MLLSSLVAAAALAQPAEEPVRICVQATVKRNGTVAQPSVVTSSGDKVADRRALRYVRMLNLAPFAGYGGVEPHTGYTVVTLKGTDAFVLSLEGGRKLFASCEAAAE